MVVVSKKLIEALSGRDLLDVIDEKLGWAFEVDLLQEPCKQSTLLKILLDRRVAGGEKRKIREAAISEAFSLEDMQYHYIGIEFEITSVGDTYLEQKYLLETFEKVLGVVKEVLGDTRCQR